MADMTVVTGTINSGATNISVDVTSLAGPIVVGGNTLTGKVNVTMTTNYARSIPPGFPRAPCLTGAAGGDYPQTLQSGSTYQLLACEAAALINASAATFVSNA
jgi:hypothetical protein